MSHALAVPLLRVEGHDIWSHAVPISPFENLVKTLKPIPTGFVIQQACAIKHVSNKAFKAGLLTCLVAFNAPTKFHTASSARNEMVGIGSKAQCCLSLRDTFYAQGQDLTSIPYINSKMKHARFHSLGKLGPLRIPRSRRQ